MERLNFYDVDKTYVNYLQSVEKKMRGFTRVPNMEYSGQQKFLCGIVLNINSLEYYVPVSSYKKKTSENILIIAPDDKKNQVKGSLRFNYMFPVPSSQIRKRIIKNEPDVKKRMLLNKELRFCLDRQEQILTQAKRTYQIVVKKLNPFLLNNACDFLLLEDAAKKFSKVSL